MTQEEFLNIIIPAAVEAEKKFKIPAEVTVGQAILESGWGKSKLTQRANNLFGIKAGPEWHERTLTMVGHEFVHGRMVSVPISWRAYSSLQASIDDHSKFLLKPRYKSAFEHTNNYEKFLEHIWKNGYATDPNYVKGILAVVNRETIKQKIEEVRNAK